MGVLCKNENKASEMCEIMDDFHKYVPMHTQDAEDSQGQISSDHSTSIVYPILLGGDQLTIARVRGSQKLRNNEYTPADRLEGFIPFAQDWHAFVAFLDVSILTLTK